MGGDGGEYAWDFEMSVAVFDFRVVVLSFCGFTLQIATVLSELTTKWVAARSCVVISRISVANSNDFT